MILKTRTLIIKSEWNSRLYSLKHKLNWRIFKSFPPKKLPVNIEACKILRQYVGNKAEGQISKRMFQENKARQIFRKTNTYYPLITTRRYEYQGVKKFIFRKIWCALFSWNTRFEIRLFALLPTIF